MTMFSPIFILLLNCLKFLSGFVVNGIFEQNYTDTLNLEDLPISQKIPNALREHFLQDQEDPTFDFKPSECQIPEWNTIRTENILELELHRGLYKRNLGGAQTYLYAETPCLLAAFAHKDQIVVTLTNENLFGKSVYCRYYDCNRKELLDQFESFVYPESTVFCPRRIGAKYISISKTLGEKVEYSVPIIPRITGPKHYFTVCIAPVYGDEPKFLQLAEFIEYYKQHGATYFHVYIRNISDYDRILLDDYVRTGDIEVIKLHDHYWRDDWMWHNSQINDCHHRNKYFSKWTALVDLDEHITMRTDKIKRIVDLLDSVPDPNINNLNFRVQWVIKEKDSIPRYISDEQILDDLAFRKYKNSSQIGHYWRQPKCIIRPERIAAMTIHAPVGLYHGVKTTMIEESIGVVRHYRNVQNRVFPEGLSAMLEWAPFVITDVPEWIKDRLAKAILNRVKWIFDIADVPCEKKMYLYKMYETNVTCSDEK